MKKFVYIVTDRNRTSLHAGMSADLIKTLAFYKQMPSLFFDSGQQLTRLVYFEEFKTEAQALSRFKLISRFTRMQKERLVRSCNPDWVDLTIGLDFEHIMSNKVINTQVQMPLGIMS
ncbi:GIY-YIG nuclease family protein [Pedobacter nutrimenti]|jgi:putative endonuclease|uniref:Putative endonuclease n=1 Tax=Pedobacter nutrimenti TaxID=1241337 RepID=A0A318UNZ6_9SPHI|nr:GIY-YIG nuclease family protein [Pedobacter nutrimenti]PYF76818.1 putative endonuclease [Pedobacter nutrimenti]